MQRKAEQIYNRFKTLFMSTDHTPDHTPVEVHSYCNPTHSHVADLLIEIAFAFIRRLHLQTVKLLSMKVVWLLTQKLTSRTV